MLGAIFGFIGVLVGSSITWLQAYWTTKRTSNKNAKYLAIRVVCILDKYLEDCADVVKDNGLSYGQRTEEGYLKPQVKVPGPPVFPEDVDWKSLDHDLMYQLLSLPSEVESGDRMIKFSADISNPPDFEDWFIERKFRYSQFGLIAYKLSEKLCIKYSIKKKTYNDWNPLDDLAQEYNAVLNLRNKRKEGHKRFIRNVLGEDRL